MNDMNNGEINLINDILKSIINYDKKLTIGEINYLTGPSGSGKTTLLKNINNKITSTSMIWQNPISIINPFTNVYNQLSEVCKYNDTDLVEIIKITGIDNILNYSSKKLNNLSGGEQQRFMIAFGIATNASIILADEITANLDFEASCKIIELISNICKSSDKTFIIATHDIELIKSSDNRLEMK
jgi:ABC-type lipoprotein export system ATPase subunit